MAEVLVVKLLEHLTTPYLLILAYFFASILEHLVELEVLGVRLTLCVDWDQLQSHDPFLEVVLETLRFVETDLDPAKTKPGQEVVDPILDRVLRTLLG